MKNLLNIAVNAALEGGAEILEVYNSEFAVETKDDKSPLTLADKRAHEKICAHLEATEIPVLSEEGSAVPYEERSTWKRFWMVDPLDGTKEFIKRNGEFTVNIALIEDGHPVAGVIYVPVKKDLYAGIVGDGAFKATDVAPKAGADYEDLERTAQAIPFPKNGKPFTAVGSRSHMSEETQAFFAELREKHGTVEVVSMGSSLKICLVAEGVADIYPRFAPTMEWDTAAGHAIARAAGKEITDRKTGKPMRYNKENLLNNWFVVQ